MSDFTDYMVIKKALGKLCEQKKESCYLIHDFVNANETGDLLDQARQYLCPGKDDEKCEAEFNKLKKQAEKEDKEYYQEDEGKG